MRINEAFNVFFSVVTFPGRYLGGKKFSILGVAARFPGWFYSTFFSSNTNECSPLFGKGYQHFVTEILPKDEARDNVKYAALSAAGHSHKFDLSEPFGYSLVDLNAVTNVPKGFLAKKNCFFNSETGVKVTLFKSSSESVIVFGAIDSYKTEVKDQKDKDTYHRNLSFAAALSLFGYVPSYYKDVDRVMNTIFEAGLVEGSSTVCVGQCFGGNLAEYASLKYNMKSVVFNALPMGAGVQTLLGKDKLENADSHVTNITVEGDQFADGYKVLGYFDVALSMLGLRTPGNFGKKLKIPSAYSTAFETHRFILGSFMNLLGYDKKAHPKNLFESS